MMQQKAYEAFQDRELPKQLEAAQRQVEEVQAKLAALYGENDALDAALQALKTEGEDTAAADKERLDGLVRVVETLTGEVEKRKQQEEYAQSQQRLAESKQRAAQTENEARSQEVELLSKHQEQGHAQADAEAVSNEQLDAYKQKEQALRQQHQDKMAKLESELKQRESKIYSLVEKQSAYLKAIDVGMDEDVAAELQREEAQEEERRRKALDEQAKRDEEYDPEYVRSLLLMEENKAKGGKGSKAKEAGVAQLMSLSNANSTSKNLSQQIASVALAQQRECLMGGKAKKSVLDLWIKRNFKKLSHRKNDRHCIVSISSVRLCELCIVLSAIALCAHIFVTDVRIWVNLETNSLHSSGTTPATQVTVPAMDNEPHLQSHHQQ